MDRAINTIGGCRKVAFVNHKRRRSTSGLDMRNVIQNRKIGHGNIRGLALRITSHCGDIAENCINIRAIIIRQSLNEVDGDCASARSTWCNIGIQGYRQSEINILCAGFICIYDMGISFDAKRPRIVKTIGHGNGNASCYNPR